jgi:RNA ligase (TIGR02306 family)
MRKLATIQKIKELNPIPGADAIEVASILGWKVVVRKGEFKVGDLCVYCEIDSVMPDTSEFQFLRDKKFRIKTCRLKGQISQGIAFPLAIFRYKTEQSDWKEGTDVTELLEITQYIYQIPVNLAGQVKGQFPSFIPKTDETRVQVLQSLLNRYYETECYITEKVDGCSVTYYLKDGEFGVCSRNLELKETEDNLFWKLARELKIEEKLRTFNKNVALQGELIGAGIQKNNLKIPEKKILFFTIFDIDRWEYYSFSLFKRLIEGLGLETVPIISESYFLDDNIDKLVEMSKGISLINKKVFREGIVIRPLVEKIDLQMSNDWGNGRVSFKVVNPEYLLKYEE